MISNQWTSIKKKFRMESILIALILLSSDKKYKVSHWSGTQKTSFCYFDTRRLNSASVSWGYLKNSMVLSATAKVLIQQVHRK